MPCLLDLPVELQSIFFYIPISDLAPLLLINKLMLGIIKVIIDEKILEAFSMAIFSLFAPTPNHKGEFKYARAVRLRNRSYNIEAPTGKPVFSLNFDDSRSKVKPLDIEHAEEIYFEIPQPPPPDLENLRAFILV